MKKLKKILLVICIALVLIFASICVWHTVGLKAFYERAEQAFLTPGHDDAQYNQQGMNYDPASDLFFFGGYMRNKTADPIYLVKPDSGEVVKKVLLLDPDGEPQTTHAGGLVVRGDYVYLAGSKACCLYVYDREAILNAEDGSTLPCIGVFSTQLSAGDGVKASFLGADENCIYVGEFHLPLLPMYWLRGNHRLTTSMGRTYALMAGFAFDSSKPLGLCEKPCAVYALPSRVQGAAFRDGQVYLSRSFGLALSTLSVHSVTEEGSFTLMDAEVPLYTLREERSIKALPMSEEIDFYQDRLYVSSELIHAMIPDFGRPWEGEYCYCIDPELIR